MQLRNYQSSAIGAARGAIGGMAPGRRRSVLLVAPTGSGKTVIGAEIVRSAVAKGRRALWLSHRTELIDQAAIALEGLRLRVGVVAASSARRPNPHAAVQVASVDTLTARAQRPEADLVVLDEAHHGAAKTFRELLAGYPAATVVGLTATPERSDGSGLGGDLFSRMVVVATPAELLGQGHLVPLELVRPATPLRPGQIAQRPADAWRQHANGRSAIVFCATVEHARIVAAEFLAVAEVITAQTPWAARARVLGEFRAGRVRVLCNVAVLTEGTDLPNTSCIIVARGCGTAGLWLQMTGRGARPSPGKRDCVVIDLRGVSHAHGHPYDAREYSLDGRGIASAQTPADQAYCRVCGAPTEPGQGCGDCGVAARDRSVTVTGDALVKYAHLAQFTDDQRARMLATLLRKHANPKQAFIVYARMHGHWPKRELQNQARELLVA